VRGPAARGRHPRTRRGNGARRRLGCAEEWRTARRAQQAFAAFVTVDRNLPFQQDLSRFSIAIIVLRARSNRLGDLRAIIPHLLTALPAAKPGEATWIGAEQPA